MFKFLRVIGSQISSYFSGWNKKKEKDEPAHWRQMAPLTRPKVMVWKSRKQGQGQGQG